MLRLLPLRSANSDVWLNFQPQDLRLHEIILVILAMIGRSIVHALGIHSDKQILRTKRLPKLSLSMPFSISSEDVNEFASAVEAENADSIQDDSLQICLMLAALSEPAMLLLLAKRGCPIRPLGTVNVRNRFELLRPDLCTSDQLIQMKEIMVTASLVEEMRIVKRGIELDIDVTLHSTRNANDTSVIIFRQIFTILQFTHLPKGTYIPQTDVKPNAREQRDETAHETAFSLRMDAPSAWARLCKDYNPIHISSILAKFFGFPGKLAHGNHVLCLGLEAWRYSNAGMHNALLEKAESQPVWIEVRFKRPVVLPADLNFQLVSKTRPHVAPFSTFEILRMGKTLIEGEAGLLS